MNQYKEILKKIQEADAILIGASNGFSISEGLNLFANDEKFEKLFGDFKRKYGVDNILHGSFTKYPTEEEKWAFFSRLVSYYSGEYTGSENTEALKEIIENKPYFIITSNGENHFELTGFNPEYIYEIEGSWKYMQCARACHKTLYPAFELMKKMNENEKDGKIPSDLVPHCPKCGGNMQLNVALDNNFIPNEVANQRLQNFIEKYHNKNLVVLELGIGMRNQMIKAPLMNLVAHEPNSTYITLNKGEVYIPIQIAEKSYGLDGDMTELLAKIVEMKKCQ
ncbi:hypothetical protein [Terrisporobacter sp.]